jgi:7-cyano-7-deazaguanine synthase in queuosine biosynthesis
MNRVNRVLLYSGGLDSHCAAWIWKPDLCLYVFTGAPYELWELENMRHNLTAPAPVHEIYGTDLSAHALPNHMVPQRNAFLVLHAAFYGNTIAMAVTEGDGITATDKDNYFRDSMTRLLGKLWARTPTSRPVEMVLPWKLKTKSELVRMALRAGMPAADAIATPSCYMPNGDACGTCNACVRKWVALELNGIEWHLRDRAAASITDATIAAAKAGKYRMREGAETLEALRLIGRLP